MKGRRGKFCSVHNAHAADPASPRRQMAAASIDCRSGCKIARTVQAATWMRHDTTMLPPADIISTMLIAMLCWVTNKRKRACAVQEESP